jgi:hypothetical protein
MIYRKRHRKLGRYTGRRLKQQYLFAADQLNNEESRTDSIGLSQDKEIINLYLELLQTRKNNLLRGGYSFEGAKVDYQDWKQTMLTNGYSEKQLHGIQNKFFSILSGYIYLK